MSQASVFLSVQAINEAIDEVCGIINLSKLDGFTVRRAKHSDFLREERMLDDYVALLFGIITVLADGHRLLTTFYFTYSTWDGRVLYLDQLGLPDERNKHVILTNSLNHSLVLLQILSKIAVRLHCRRFTYNYHGNDYIYPDNIQSESHHGVLNLYWHADDMRKHINQDDPTKVIESRENSSSISIRQKINSCLKTEMASAPTGVRMRLSTIDDIDTIVRLVKGLATFVQEPDSAVKVTPECYLNDGFVLEIPGFYCFLLDHYNNKHEVKTIGMAFCYIGYNLDAGKFWYIDDLFIQEEYRKQGYGKFVMKMLASISLAMDCSRMVWQCLEWNSNALNFYERIGASIQKGLKTSRLANDTLKQFAGTLC